MAVSFVSVFGSKSKGWTSAASTNSRSLLRFAAAVSSARGGAGNDSIFAGAGNDTIYGDAGVDSLDGEAGDDVFYAQDTTFKDSLFGGTGNDKAQRDNSATVVDAINSIEAFI